MKAKGKRSTIPAYEAELAKILKTKTFDEALKAGDIIDIEGAAKKLGYSEYHVRRLCAALRLDHFLRNETEYYFLASQLRTAFKIVARA